MQILQLEKHLKDQQVVRGALEKSLGPNAGPVNQSVENPMPKVALSLRTVGKKHLSPVLIRFNYFNFSGC
jgi:hypothetical protein